MPLWDSVQTTEKMAMDRQMEGRKPEMNMLLAYMPACGQQKMRLNKIFFGV
jgi:hypothetical protein